MAYDFKKDSKEFYRSKNKTEIVNVPKANYIAVRGSGDPNEEGGAYQQAISVLYAVAYTLKMSYKTDYKKKAFMNMWFRRWKGFGGRRMFLVWIIAISLHFAGFQSLGFLILYPKRILTGQ